MQKITTNLWFDTQAQEAAEFYTSVFNGGDSCIKDTTIIHNTPSGSVDIVTIQLWDQEFTLISAGPLFKFTPAVSFLVACKTKEEVNVLWEKLSKGGKIMMELGEYPFSGRYGWTADKYGVSWQVMFMGERAINQKITPTMMFVGDVCGKAEEAMEFYVSVFKNSPTPDRGESKIGDMMRYPKGAEPDKEGTITHASFMLEGQYFAAMDSAHKHDFTFNEAISFMVHCENQEEIDYYWDKLSVVPESEQCGWLKDKFGFSWQIVPTAMEEMFKEKDEKKIARVTEALLEMKKLDIAKLEEAAKGG